MWSQVGQIKGSTVKLQATCVCVATLMCSRVLWDVWAHCVVHCDVGGGHLTDGANFPPG